MKRTIAIAATLAALLIGSVAAQNKPTILISGEGNLSINTSGGVVAGEGWAASNHQATINKHDQTMEMAQDFIKFCPAAETSLNITATPDYFVSLNREGQATLFGEIGKSQIMVLNRRKTVVFVTKKATVANAVKSACNAIAADWQTNGRLPLPTPPQPPAAATPAKEAETSDTKTPLVPVAKTVALVFRTTAAAEKRCKPQTIADIQNDIPTYLASKTVAVGVSANANYVLTVIVDRPMSKWIEITMQAKDAAGNLLWSEKRSDGGWGHLGTEGLLKTLAKLHEVIDAKLGDQNGLPLLPITANK